MNSRSFCMVNLGAFAQDPDSLRSMMERLVELIDAGVLRPAVDRVFPLGEVPQAISQLRNRANIGKFVVSLA
jgi:NADPH:quinone reductase-like Zn-dependent oxidoreductase